MLRLLLFSDYLRMRPFSYFNPNVREAPKAQSHWNLSGSPSSSDAPLQKVSVRERFIRSSFCQEMKPRIRPVTTNSFHRAFVQERLLPEKRTVQNWSIDLSDLDSKFSHEKFSPRTYDEILFGHSLGLKSALCELIKQKSVAYSSSSENMNLIRDSPSPTFYPVTSTASTFIKDGHSFRLVDVSSMPQYDRSSSPNQTSFSKRNSISSFNNFGRTSTMTEPPLTSDGKIDFQEIMKPCVHDTEEMDDKYNFEKILGLSSLSEESPLSSRAPEPPKRSSSYVERNSGTDLFESWARTNLSRVLVDFQDPSISGVLNDTTITLDTLLNQLRSFNG